ncbi:MAG TPA: cell division protein FtsA [Bacilli bacterium]|nr:cell division protein FtsA [Bacilli bacterium]
MRQIISSIDIGSSSIKIVVGEMVKNKLNILAVSDTPSLGINKGLIVNAKDFIDSLKKGLNKAEETIGLKIKKTIVNIPANNANFYITEGSTTITNEDHIVTGNDIARALQGCVYNKFKSSEELISIMPIYFLINDETKVKDPKNIIANKLTAKSVIVTTPKKNVYSVLTCLEKLNIEVIDITLNSIGDYYANNYNDLNDKVGAIVNMGHETTTVSIFNKGVLTNTNIIDLGGKNVENDISFIYKINKNDAHNLKEKLSLAHKRLAQASEVEKVTNKLGEEIKVNQYEISEIVMSRLLEILKLVKKEINLLTKKEISYIIFTGGVTESLDFELVLESVYGKSAAVTQIKEIGVRNNIYSSAVGMIKYFCDKMQFRNKKVSIFSIEEQEELGTFEKYINVSENSVLGKLFGYFFDN